MISRISNVIRHWLDWCPDIHTVRTAPAIPVSSPVTKDPVQPGGASRGSGRIRRGKVLGDSFAYTRDGVFGKINKWILLIVATIILGIPLLGYLMKIFRGEKPAPEVTGWRTLFMDGIRAFIICLIYAVPVIVVTFLAMGSMAGGALEGSPVAGFAGAGILALVVLVLAIIIALIELIGLIRFARSGNIGAAFDFNAILVKIGKIGWVDYIIAHIVLILVVAVGVYIPLVIIAFMLGALDALVAILGFGAVPRAMPLIFLVIVPLVAVFESRYFVQIYDSAQE